MDKDMDPIPPEVLAARLLARALHDVAGPTSGLTSALDLLTDAPDADLRAEALTLARDSLGLIGRRIAFFRAAFGGGGLDGATFAGLMDTPFAGSRARLQTASIAAGAPPLLLQGLLTLLQITAEGLGAGGVAQLTVVVEDSRWRGAVVAEGPRARIHPEALAGLQGQAPPYGPAGRWAPARYVEALSSSAGGRLHVKIGENEFGLELVCPA